MPFFTYKWSSNLQLSEREVDWKLVLNSFALPFAFFFRFVAKCRAAEGTAGAELPANVAPDVLDARCTLTSERKPSPVARPLSSELLLRKDTLRRWGSEQRTEAASAATTAPAIPATASEREWRPLVLEPVYAAEDLDM
ncbi:hypothetical protein KFK09_010433 [Dendrobium nobile]|uniref:Uncharacterized protein n=1 Tax=Dendrobium nobile TaxID=94219 RepID=A0A8T3BA09_DENNO|nr:hypothetical protein KFK09_010433 [Dendrobium nobile]